MHPTTARPTITVNADGAGIVSHVGSRLRTGMADRSGLTEAFSQALSGLRERRSGHAPGRVLTDLAVLLADGGPVSIPTSRFDAEWVPRLGCRAVEPSTKLAMALG